MRHVSPQENWYRLKRINAAFRAEPEACILSIICVLSGLTSLVYDRPVSVEALLHDGAQIAWSVCLFSGGLLRSYGLLTRRPNFDGAGCVVLGWACLLFAWAAISFSIRGLSGAIMIAGFGYACFARWNSYRRISRSKKEMEGG